MRQMGKKAKKIRVAKTDGMGPEDIKKIMVALRKVWSWSFSRRLVVQRCIGRGGFSYCEKCKKRSPKIFVDHTKPVGAFDNEYAHRLFVPSTKMKGLCKECHKEKTKRDLVDIRFEGYSID